MRKWGAGLKFDLRACQEYNVDNFTLRKNRHVNHSRPKNLNLFTIHFPIPAIVSILHRISGVLLFLAIPIGIWAYQYSQTAEGFSMIQDRAGSPLIKVIIWLLFVPFCYHFVAGIRHLLMDVHLGESLQGGRLTSVLTFIISFILMALAGIWLW